MKKPMFSSEVAIASVLIGILIVCLNPFGLFMPPPILNMLLIILLITFGIFAATVWREHEKDEREKFHKLFAGHLAFLTGTTLLVIGIIIQELNHTLDPWLVYTLVGMVLAKIIGRIYSERNF